MAKKVRKFGLIGKTLHHSFSKGYFDTRFKVEDPFLSYENIELPDAESVEEWLENKTSDFVGVNVTIPYKSTVIPFLDELSTSAKEIGAVNTIHFVDGKKIGYNTDEVGFIKSIRPYLSKVHKRALILGTGGASKAVAYAMRNEGIEVAFVSRNAVGKKNAFSYEEMKGKSLEEFQIIVNTTPLGTSPKIDEMPDFPIHKVTEKHLVFDLIYNPDETKFLQMARKSGATTCNGLEMLKQQALAAWKIWNK